MGNNHKLARFARKQQGATHGHDMATPRPSQSIAVGQDGGVVAGGESSNASVNR